MSLPSSVSRLIARLAFLASLLFAVGSGPTSALTTLLVAANSDAGALDDREEDANEEVALHRPTAQAEEQAERDERRRGLVASDPPVARAVPFTPPHRVTRAPPRPPYRPLLRMLC
jgi:hypothetical protein